MKKLITLLVLLAMQLSFSQTKPKDSVPDFRKNEIKINALYLILGAFEGTYERALNDESAVGASVTFLLDGENDINTAFAFSPYYRLYFGKKPVSGFFVEGFAQYAKINYNEYEYFYNPNTGESTYNEYDNKISAFALGIGLGGKWYTKSNILFEINAGIGRNLSISSDNPNTDYSRITGKFAIGIGYRF
jgi:hypothetical protein